MADVARRAYVLAPTTPVHTALASMRETRNHLAVVPDEQGGYAVVTLADVLARIIPRVATT